MSKIGFIRKQTFAPGVPEDAIVVPDPGEISRPTPSRPPTWVWMVIVVIGVVALLVILYKTGVRSLATGGTFIMPIMLLSMVMAMRNRGGGDKKNRGAAKNQERADYLRVLDELREDVHKAARAQAAEIAFHHPDPCDGSLATLVGTARMWERGPDTRGNWGHVRLGVGVTRLKTKLTPPMKVPPPEFRETVTTVGARDFLHEQNVVHDVPRPIHLFDQIGWAFFAEPEQRATIQGILRALVCQLCVFHGPDDVQVAIITDDLPSWDWAKWLPHTGDPDFVDACGPMRLIFADVRAFMDRFETDVRSRPPFAPTMEGSEKPDRWMVVVVDLPGADCSPLLGDQGRTGISVLEATGNEHSLLANADSAYLLDEVGNLLKAAEYKETY
ncbi:cell division protein FtsK [Mycolicibacter sinensis]|uniref:Cell division protein FtsK n=1 Tax=Mycolicibacter sinensis (strain JDM601) TaxID=875328 RepID=A0A1A2XF49_MYCSD|nr:cell division protein FtsK [Mycolicibacter sinensis]OBI24295.1 cell division protein FtsK [Mycolicibacter sinensis]